MHWTNVRLIVTLVFLAGCSGAGSPSVEATAILDPLVAGSFSRTMDYHASLRAQTDHPATVTCDVGVESSAVTGSDTFTLTVEGEGSYTYDGEMKTRRTTLFETDLNIQCSVA